MLLQESLPHLRLDQEQLAALDFALQGLPPDQVYLFGSRLDLKKRGGDIDILIFSEAEPFQLSHQVAVKFFEKCEEKIDVLVMNPNRLTEEQQAFLNQICKLQIA